MPHTLSIAVCVIAMSMNRSLAQSNTSAFEWQQETNYGGSPLIISNLLVTNITGTVTNVPPLLVTNMVVTNIFITQTNYGPWGPGGPPITPPRKPWYKRFWDWLRGLL